MVRRRAAALAAAPLVLGVVLTVVLGVAVAGCSTDAGSSGPEPGAAPSSSPTPEPPGVRVGDPVWSTRSSGLERPELLAVGDAVLLVADDRSGGRASLRVLDAGTGRQRWRLDADAPDAYRIVTSAAVGADAAGRELVSVRYERQTCTADATSCRYDAGIEVREARTGTLRWRWEPARQGTDASLTGAVITPVAVLVQVRGDVLGLDPVTGRRLWRTDGPLPGMIDDGLGVQAPEPGDDTYRVLDLATGEQVSTVESRWGVGAVHAGLAQHSVGGQVVLQDLLTGERQIVDEGGDIPPLSLRSDGGFAWLSSDDRLLTLLPGEDEPTAAPLPEGISRRQAATAFFAGDLAGGVLVVRTPDGVRTVSRAGAVDDTAGPRTRSVTDVHDGTVVLGGPRVFFRSDLPIEVRPIR